MAGVQIVINAISRLEHANFFHQLWIFQFGVTSTIPLSNLQKFSDDGQHIGGNSLNDVFLIQL
jgi:putative IMPACT (imprinted ancient) family translation regulator